MKLTLLILTLAVFMATVFEVTGKYDDKTEINSLIESLLQSANQQRAGIKSKSKTNCCV